MSEAARQAWHVETALLPQGWARDVRIEFSHGLISAISRGVPAAPGDLPVAIGLPGMPNVHSHAFQRAMAGLTETRGPGDDGFGTWREFMYRFAKRLDPEAVRAIAAFAYMEMLESGFVSVGEFHYLHHDADGRAYPEIAEMALRISDAAAMTGIGLTLLPVFYAHNGFGGAAPHEGQRRFICDVDAYARLVEMCRERLAGAGVIVGIAPHSLRAVTPEELRAILPLGEGPVHIHVSEQAKEVADCLAWSNARPVEWLLANAPVDDRWSLVHATHVDEQEMRGVAASGAVVGLCPTTEANLGDGLFPAPRYVGLNGRFGIGSDSNVRIDMAEELRLLEYGQRLVNRSRNLLAGETVQSTGRHIFERALAGGAMALGRRGGLAVGAPADLVTLDARSAALEGRRDDQIVDTLIFGASQRLIADVWRGGEQVVSSGRHGRRDEIERAYRAAITAVMPP